jgi:hypothetical protein
MESTIADIQRNRHLPALGLCRRISEPIPMPIRHTSVTYAKRMYRSDQMSLIELVYGILGVIDICLVWLFIESY